MSFTTKESTKTCETNYKNISIYTINGIKINILSIDIIKKLNYYEFINYLSIINEIKEILDDNNNIIKYIWNNIIINIDNFNDFIKDINETTIITIVIQKLPNIYSTLKAHAIINNNGNVITWGHPFKCNSIKVQFQLRAW